MGVRSYYKKRSNKLNIEEYITKKKGQQNLTQTGHFNDKRNMGIYNESYMLNR